MYIINVLFSINVNVNVNIWEILFWYIFNGVNVFLIKLKLLMKGRFRNGIFFYLKLYYNLYFLNVVF